MNDVLYNLWWNGLCPRKTCKADDPYFEEIKRTREQKREKLYATLNEEQKEMLREYEYILTSEHNSFSSEAFYTGFRLGAQLTEAAK